MNDPNTNNPKSISIKKSLLIFIIIPAVLLSSIAIIAFDSELWVMGGLDHFYFEMISVILSTIVAIFFLSRGIALKDKLSLFIGLGFQVAAIIDLLHGIFAIMNLGNVIFEGYFIPQTWVAGRILMSIVMVIAIFKFGNMFENSDKKLSLRKELIVYTSFLSIIAVIITAISLIQPLPFLIIDFDIQRPYEMSAAILFAVAILFFYKRKLHSHYDTFYKGFLLALLIDVFVNLIISYSSFVFDTAFNVAHFLKNVSYFVFIVTLSSSAIHHYYLKKRLSEDLIAELKIKQNELIKSERFSAIGELSARMAHDIRNPLSTILASISIIEHPKVEPQMVRASIERTHRAINRIDHQINDVMNFLRDTRLDNKEIFLKTFFEGLISSMNVPDTIKIKLFEKNISISADEIKMESLFSNLLLNSMQSMNDKGNITVRISEKLEENAVQIEIEDEGEPIPEDIIDRIFEPLFTTKSKGTGLGLAACSKIVTQHNGSISVRNNPTTFTVVIPINQKETSE